MMRKFILKNAIITGNTLDAPPHAKIEVEAEDVMDEYHTMHELYQHRMALFCALCKVYSGGYSSVGICSWKSKLHSDGNIPFNDNNYFIAGIESPEGQITYHMKIDKWWDKFDIIEIPRAYKYDGHTSQDVIERLLKL